MKMLETSDTKTKAGTSGTFRLKNFLRFANGFEMTSTKFILFQMLILFCRGAQQRIMKMSVFGWKKFQAAIYCYTGIYYS
jgi:hypothetical protein